MPQVNRDEALYNYGKILLRAHYPIQTVLSEQRGKVGKKTVLPLKETEWDSLTPDQRANTLAKSLEKWYDYTKKTPETLFERCEHLLRGDRKYLDPENTKICETIVAAHNLALEMTGSKKGA